MASFAVLRIRHAQIERTASTYKRAFIEGEMGKMTLIADKEDTAGKRESIKFGTNLAFSTETQWKTP